MVSRLPSLQQELAKLQIKDDVERVSILLSNPVDIKFTLIAEEIDKLLKEDQRFHANKHKRTNPEDSHNRIPYFRQTIFLITDELVKNGFIKRLDFESGLVLIPYSVDGELQEKDTIIKLYWESTQEYYKKELNEEFKLMFGDLIND